MKKFVQRGFNIDWPEKILDTWKRGEIIPEWLSDRANVTIMSSDGIKNIEIRETSSGGYEIVDSGKIGVLVSLKNSDWFVAWDGKRILSISPDQLEFLYKKENSEKH